MVQYYSILPLPNGIAPWGSSNKGVEVRNRAPRGENPLRDNISSILVYMQLGCILCDGTDGIQGGGEAQDQPDQAGGR